MGRAPDVVSDKSSHSLALARSADWHGREGSTYSTSSTSFVGVCLLPRHGPPELGWPVCAGPPAAAQSLRLRPRATDEARGSRVLAHDWRHGRPSRHQSLELPGRRLGGAALLGRAREFKMCTSQKVTLPTLKILNKTPVILTLLLQPLVPSLSLNPLQLQDQSLVLFFILSTRT